MIENNANIGEMQLKDLTIEEFRELVTACVRETVEAVIDERLEEMLDPDPVTVKDSFRDGLLELRDRRLRGEVQMLSREQVLQALDLGDCVL